MPPQAVCGSPSYRPAAVPLLAMEGLVTKKISATTSSVLFTPSPKTECVTARTIYKA